jgi:hypothetical protein
VSLIILTAPLVISIYGWKIMRDVVFDYFAQQGFQWGMFALGLLCFIGGLSFAGGFVYYRDKKRRYGKRFKDDLDD